MKVLVILSVLGLLGLSQTVRADEQPITIWECDGPGVNRASQCYVAVNNGKTSEDCTVRKNPDVTLFLTKTSAELKGPETNSTATNEPGKTVVIAVGNAVYSCRSH